MKATEIIRAMNRPDAAVIPIIAVTADSFNEEGKKTIEAGMNRHITKPVEPELLYDTIRDCVAERLKTEL